VTRTKARRLRIERNRRRRAVWLGTRKLSDDPASHPYGMYYGRDGRPMSLRRWARHFEIDHEYKWVARTRVGNLRVSTVWLGIDHAFGSENGPLIFETMVFAPPGWAERECQRHRTEAEAREAHARVVERLRSVAS
jgi:hypothetical protein